MTAIEPTEAEAPFGGSDKRHRLEGLEFDNLLAFLALLGLLRALEAIDSDSRDAIRPRASWDIDNPPLRPVLHVARPMTRDAICEAVAQAVAVLAAHHDFAGANDIKFSVEAARSLKECALGEANATNRYLVDLYAALIGSLPQDAGGDFVGQTPLAYPSVATSNFLKNFMAISRSEMPEKRKDLRYPSGRVECIHQALFDAWDRRDRPVGLRWDPAEAKRHAYQWRAPTKDAPTGQHGANRLAIIGLSALTISPTVAGTRVTSRVIAGEGGGDTLGIAWPIWREPASLSSIRALLSHPRLRQPGSLGHLGVDHVRETRRISLDRLRNFTLAELLSPRENGRF